ncbi:esterase family protein [Kribbella solani]|uniref:Esterase/lipase superfamily enzyme n=1 Tax=Kribbella solani TaxID=236067 RepID=A0A841DWK0_9ACTN|nr:alpha/beta hydrolase-fold protein [Kribbella solani]MBB5981136.1 esterase/lipase superfamily enzyme [Kribbella solani]MDX2970863.1 alpha/beta hydrolase-fold protein [Kribbella solani]MDX3003708.1 alpha/beta hydrolase-fold protein [Kribbella solani]
MERVQVELEAPGLDRRGTLIRYGHFGRPVLVFPSEQGRAWDYENNGMVDAVAHLIEAGRVKLYCVDSYDHVSWSDRSIQLEVRARRHEFYESWIVNQVVPKIAADSPGVRDIITTGCSLGAYHALNFAFKRSDLFPIAICQSGNYDAASWHAWGERGDATYFNNPADYLPNLSGEHLEWLRKRLFILLTVGQGDWETHPTGSLPSARATAAVLEKQGIPHELDLWGYDVAHDWPWWRQQLARHLPRFC